MLSSLLKIAREGTAVVAVSVAVLSAPLAEAAPQDRGSPAAHAAVEGAPLVGAGATVAGLGTWSLVASLTAKSAMVAAGVAPGVLAVSAGSTLLIAGSAVVVVAGVALLGWGAYKAYKAYKSAKAARDAQNPPQPPAGPGRPGDPASPGNNGGTTNPTGPNPPGDEPGRNGGGLRRPIETGRTWPGSRVVTPPTEPPVAHSGSNVSRNDATRAPGAGASRDGVRPGRTSRPSGAGMER